MKITITAGEALDKDIWDKICYLRGINPWAVNEGQMDSTEAIDLTEEEAHYLGLI